MNDSASTAPRHRDLARLAHTHRDTHGQKISEFFAAYEAVADSVETASPQAISSYIICFVNRSGSNFLAAALRSTGTMGSPREFFNYPEVIEFSREAGIRSLRQYTRTIIQNNISPNRVFGMKLGAGQLLYLTREAIIPSLVSDPVFVYVTRRDIVAQAVSFVIASQTVRWNSELPGNGTKPKYDAEAILANLQWISESQSLFEYYFAIHGIQPLRLVYEEFETNVVQAIAEIGAALRLPAPTVAVDEIGLRKQRTSLNDEFKRRFLEEVKFR